MISIHGRRMGAFAPFMSSEPQAALSWAKKRNEQRRQHEAKRQKQAA